MKSAAEEATDMLEDSMETTRESVREAQFKALEMAKANTDAAFDLFKQLLTTTRLPTPCSCRRHSRASASRRWSTIPRTSRRP